MTTFKTAGIVFLLILLNTLSAQAADFQTTLQSMLNSCPSYIQAQNRYEEEKAFFTIDNSLNWFDVNLRYQQYDNNFTRNERETVLEHSEVNEKDKRWRLELDKQFFPKDFDSSNNYLSSRINLLRYRQEMKLAVFTCSADIISDMINWYQAGERAKLIQSKLDLLYKQNLALEELVKQNQVGPELLISNLEEIENKEADLSDYQKELTVFSSIYGDGLPRLREAFQSYMDLHPLPDTLAFQQQIDAETSALQKEARQINHRINARYFNAFLPELNLTASYNWRDTDQSWDITKSGILKDRTVAQNEAYPEGVVEFSLPFDLFSNTKGKLAVLKGYRRELNFRSGELELTWQKYASERLKSYHAASLEITRKTRLLQLYQNILNLENQKYREEPSLLGTSPEFALSKATLDADEAQMKLKVAEMQIYKEIYIINSLGGGNK